MTTTILKSITYTSGGFSYNIIRDGEVVIVEMTPALLAGHNVAGCERQGKGHWDGMTAAAIRTWKHIQIPYFYTEVTGDERASLLALEARYNVQGWPARTR